LDVTGVSILRSEHEASVLTRAAGGDAAAFAQIVEKHHTDLRRVSYVICGDLDLAEDAVQQAWQIAWRKLATLRDPDRLRSWLVAVAANETRQLVRRRRRRPEVELEPGWYAAFTTTNEPDVRLSMEDLSEFRVVYPRERLGSDWGVAVEWSPDGRRLAFVAWDTLADEFTLFGADATGGEATELVPGGGAVPMDW
jgi:Sigma-70 region 2